MLDFRNQTGVFHLVLLVLLTAAMGLMHGAESTRSDAAPRINSPRLHGSRPFRPCLFTIPASGQPPLLFAADRLPTGLVLDPSTGVISGSASIAGSYPARVTVSNAQGRAEAVIEFRIGDDICLTPTMGWSSWPSFGVTVDDAQVRKAADAMVASGLRDHGYSYIMVDDGWSGQRGPDGTIEPNDRFPDLKGLCDYVHAKGLKIGIYSSPGRLTCTGFLGSLGHEAQDAQTFAAWGFDLLKYDLCSYTSEIKQPGDLAENQKPFRLMGEALRQAERDLVFNVCQWGLAKVWEWGADVGGQSWRTTLTIKDTWASVSGIGFAQNGLERWAGPGRWNDPDNLMVGMVSWGKGPARPSRLTSDEQRTQMSLWCLLAAPLVIGGDITRLDDATLRLLTNDEVLAIDQDPLGCQGRRVRQSGTVQVWMKPLADGTVAVGLFNLGHLQSLATALWSDLGLEGEQPVRDLWACLDVGSKAGGYTVTLPPHGSALLRVGNPTPILAGDPASTAPK